MQAHRRSCGIVPLILNLGIRWGQLVNFMPWLLYTWEKAPVPIVQEDMWAPGTVWINVWRKENHLHPPGFKAQTIQPVASHYTMLYGPSYSKDTVIYLEISLQ